MRLVFSIAIFIFDQITNPYVINVVLYSQGTFMAILILISTKRCTCSLPEDTSLEIRYENVLILNIYMYYKNKYGFYLSYM